MARRATADQFDFVYRFFNGLRNQLSRQKVVNTTFFGHDVLTAQFIRKIIAIIAAALISPRYTYVFRSFHHFFQFIGEHKVNTFVE